MELEEINNIILENFDCDEFFDWILHRLNYGEFMEAYFGYLLLSKVNGVKEFRI